MRVSHALVDRLVDAGIDTVFGIPGTQTLPLNDAIDARPDLRYVMARHETAVTHAAWGYAETTGEPAATLVVPGPGDVNAMNGLKNAFNDCTPLVHLSVETDPAVRGGDGIHETPPDLYDPVVKTNRLVGSPTSAAVVLEEAIATALTPPTGPVRVGIPKPALTEDVPVATRGEREREGVGSVPKAAVDDAAALLAAADRPVIVAGGGVRTANASGPLRRVADLLDAPVVTTYKGKGVLSELGDAPVAGTLSGSAAPELLALLDRADAALGVGTDFDAVATRAWSVDLPGALVHVTLDPADLGTGYDPAVGIVADARETLRALETALSDRSVDGDGTVARDRARAVREATNDRLDPLRRSDPPLTSVAALEAAREAIPGEAIVTADAGGFRVWGLNAFAAGGPRSYVNPGSWATMGTGLPSGVGAQLANPDADVVVLTGDGGLLMCVHELHTAVAEDVPVTVVVFVNDDYAIISEETGRAGQPDSDPGPGAGARGTVADRPFGWADAPIDFVALAESFGLRATRAERPPDVREALETALEAAEPTLIAVPTDPTEPQATDWMAE